MTERLARVLTPGVIVATVVIAALVVTVDTYRSISHTWDEPAHVANGLLLLEEGKYIEYQHPPLARLATAVGPYLGGAKAHAREPLPADFAGRILESFDEGRRILYGSGSYDRVLTLARLGILPFLVLVLLVTYAWTRTLLDEWTAVVATFLLAFTPVLLGNAGIATLDLPLTALAIICLYIYCRWLEQPTVRHGVALGIATGVAIMSKFSAIPFLGLCFITIALWYGVRNFRDQGRSLVTRAHMTTAAAALGALLVVCWISFGGGFVSIADPSNRPYRRVDDLFAPGTTLNQLASDALELKVVPYFVWAVLEGVKDLSYHNQIGHLSYLMGEVREFGWWYYYLVGLGLRTPLVFLGAGIAGLALLARRGMRDNWQLAVPTVAFLTVLTFVSVYSRINIGIRHVLMLYPLLAMGAAYAVMRLVRARTLRPMTLAMASVVLLAQVSSVVLAHPDHLTYFNTIAGSRPERFLITTDLDWGQDMKRLEEELRVRNVKEVAVAFFGSNDLTKHDLPGYTPLQAKMPRRGWIAISLWRLHRNDDYRWLRAYEPITRVGSSVNLYYVDTLPGEPTALRKGS
jgi:4-amino-4-deoxy-L-arabinose transferase-like glycosyltransferase